MIVEILIVVIDFIAQAVEAELIQHDAEEYGKSRNSNCEPELRICHALNLMQAGAGVQQIMRRRCFLDAL